MYLFRKYENKIGPGDKSRAASEFQALIMPKILIVWITIPSVSNSLDMIH